MLPHTPRKQSNEVFFVAEEKDKTEGFVKTSGYCLLTPQMQEVFAKLPKEKADKRSVTITEFEDYFSVCSTTVRSCTTGEKRWKNRSF